MVLGELRRTFPRTSNKPEKVLIYDEWQSGRIPFGNLRGHLEYVLNYHRQYGICEEEMYSGISPYMKYGPFSVTWSKSRNQDGEMGLMFTVGVAIAKDESLPDQMGRRHIFY